MADKNKSKLIVGFSFLLGAFLFSAATLYFMGKKNKDNAQKMASLEVQLANMIGEKSRGRLLARDVGKLTREPIALDDVLTRSEKIYGRGELNRKDGILWIDRKSSICLVTLGAVNGLEDGSRLGIFEDDNKIGDCVVDTSLDLVAYVSVVDKPLDGFKNNYYRVAKETP